MSVTTDSDTEIEIEPAFIEQIETCNETTLYFIIDQLGGMIWRIRHDVGHGRMPDSCLNDLPQLQAGIKAAIGQLTRFGIEQPLTEDGAGSEDYWKWYRWYNGWHKGMSDEAWGELELVMQAKGDTSGFRPDGTPEAYAEWEGTERAKNDAKLAELVEKPKKEGSTDP